MTKESLDCGNAWTVKKHMGCLWPAHGMWWNCFVS